MTAEYTSEMLATGAIRTGIARLAGRYPFHSSVLRRFHPTPDAAVGTIGVTAAGGDLRLLFDPGFVLGLPAAELGGVLLHEVHHVVLGHLQMDPADYPDRWALTVAQEITVNEFVMEPLPAGGIQLGQFPGFPPLESTADRYRRLEQADARFSIAGSGSGDAGDDAGGEDEPRDGGLGVVDNHDVWAVDPADVEGREAIRAVVQQAGLEAGVPTEFQAAVRGLGVGVTPGADEYRPGGRDRGRVDWRRTLRRYVGNVFTPGPAYDRPPRRCPGLIGVVAGRRQVAGAATVVAVVDTSGSISDEILEKIAGELRRLARTHTVHVVECDSAIQNVTRNVVKLK